MRRIGLIGGIGWGATAEYYRRLNQDVHRRLGGHHGAEVTVHSLDLHPLLESAGNVTGLEDVFFRAAASLQRAGAQLLAIASFTGHRYARRVAENPLPFVDLIECLGSAVGGETPGASALWATSIALGDEQLLSRLRQAAGSSFLLPDEDESRELDDIVFNELAGSNVTHRCLERLRAVAARHKARGARSIVLATTDFSAVRASLNTELPTVDATEIHCRALVDAALSGSAPGDAARG
jgi:aspartate racemase